MTVLYIYLQDSSGDLEKRFMDTVGWEKEGESGTDGESNIETNMLPYVK